MKSIIVIAAMSFMIACTAPSPANKISLDELVKQIDSSRIESHIATLASDKFMGRQPGTEGGNITVNYIKEQFEKMGVSPANGNSYFQSFNISEIKPVPPNVFTVKTSSGIRDFEVRKDFIAKTSHFNGPVEVIDKEIVFVGFGISAPEYDWDDYEGIDVKDKIVMAVFSDPGFYDSTLFNGIKGTPHAHISAKGKEAMKRGAAGFLSIFQDTGPTGYNWPLIEIMATRPTYYIEGNEPSTDEAIPFWGMVSIDMAKEILKMGGQDQDYIKSALSKEFKAVNLGISGTTTLESRLRTFETQNVIGMVKGSERPDEFVIYTAHWDHDGIKDVPVNGDSILNGAIDNASGTAMVLETARVYQNLEVKPKRSTLFFLTSAEEMGLLGAHYYADNPLYPLHKTVCVINTDASHATEPMRIAVNVLKGHTEMDTIVDDAAKVLGRIVVPDDAPQIGAFQRSDHYPFVAKGIPGVWTVGGADPMRGDSVKAMQIVYEYGPTKYHQVTDEYYEGFLMGNIALDTRHNLLIGYLAADSDIWPNWKADSPYKPLRDSLINKVKQEL